MIVTDNGLMKIGEAASAVGVASSVLRYYEREGLLAPKVKTRAGYRLYDAESVRRLEFIRTAQAVGFTLDDIRRLLDLEQNIDPPCREVQHLLEQRLADIGRKMNDLKRFKNALGRALERCRRCTDECAVLKDLHPKANKNKRRRG